MVRALEQRLNQEGIPVVSLSIPQMDLTTNSKLILKDLVGDIPQLVLRIAQIYGSDGKNNYGPNKFLHTAQQNSEIELFNQGQEQRD